MIIAAQSMLLDMLLVFARIGSAMILLPGFGNARVPMRVRVFLALSLSAALTPLVQPLFDTAPARHEQTVFLLNIATEILTGLMIGFAASLFLHAMRFSGTLIANTIGLAGIPGQPVDEQEPLSQLPSLISLCAGMVVFASGLHLLSIRALLASYDIFALGESPGPEWSLQKMVVLTRDTSLLAAQVSGPFILFAVSVNFALGLAGRFTPQLQIYFAVLGLVTLAGLLLLFICLPQMMSLFVGEYQSFLAGFGNP